MWQEAAFGAGGCLMATTTVCSELQNTIVCVITLWSLSILSVGVGSIEAGKGYSHACKMACSHAIYAKNTHGKVNLGARVET